MKKKVAIIFGAGPAGLTAAYELLQDTSVHPVIYELSGDLGGLAKTVNYKGNRIDIGGHRFFSKSDRVMSWWLRMLPLEKDSNSNNGFDIHYQNQKRSVAPSDQPIDPEKTNLVMLVRSRLSRIYFLRQFFEYPLSLSLGTVRQLGLIRTFAIGLSYLWACVFPLKPEKTLQDFFINRFGRVLYMTFFKDYTEKVWGVSCDRIDASWGAQRIKGLSITRALVHAFRRIVLRDKSIAQKGTETSLIEKFLYPKFGPGQMWEETARRIRDKGGEIHHYKRVVGIYMRDSLMQAVDVEDVRTREILRVEGDYFLSTMPVKELIASFKSPVPEDVKKVAEGLVYRDFITVGLLLNSLKIKGEKRDLIADNWIYMQEPGVHMGRLQIFNNWSPYMVRDPKTVWLGLEYFCNEGDSLWGRTDEEMKKLATEELARVGIIEESQVLDHVVIRVPKTYPAYFGAYDQFPRIQAFLDPIQNLFLIGRNGMHRYNNQDHSMLTAMTAVENIKAGRTDKANIWAVNVERDYHERKVTAVENLTEAYDKETLESGLRKGQWAYDTNLYWKRTETSYPHYPTVRHRKRFILNALKNVGFDGTQSLFDYGCGEGDVLAAIRDAYGLSPDRLGGCDLSEAAIESALRKLSSPHLKAGVFPKLSRSFDCIVCTEVVEHTPEYIQILRWIHDHLKTGGHLILTTQSGKIHASDVYTGHTQHFKLKELTRSLETTGFLLKKSQLWGFPFFTLQKHLTNNDFEGIREKYLEGGVSLKKRVVFDLAYAAYFVHDLIPRGPQIYLIAKKS